MKRKDRGAVGVGMGVRPRTLLGGGRKRKGEGAKYLRPL